MFFSGRFAKYPRGAFGIAEVNYIVLSTLNLGSEQEITIGTAPLDLSNLTTGTSLPVRA